MALLTKEAILQARPLRTEVVPVPEWGGEVMVREMTARERDLYEARMLRVVDGKVSAREDNLRALTAALSIVDEAGKLMFSETDVEQLGAASWVALDRVNAAVRRVNDNGAGGAEGTIKNSEAGPSAG